MSIVGDVRVVFPWYRVGAGQLIHGTCSECRRAAQNGDWMLRKGPRKGTSIGWLCVDCAYSEKLE